MGKHYFDPSIAEDYGLNAAVIYADLEYWCKKNEKKGKNIKEGRAWTFNTLKEIQSRHPYLSIKQIRAAIEKLKDGGMIVVSRHNKRNTDKTHWYAIGETASKYRPVSDKRELTDEPKETKGNDRNLPFVTLEDALLSPSLPIRDQIDNSVPASFTSFWAAYPKKQGRAKAKEAFSKLPPDVLPLLIPAIERQKETAQWMRDDGRYIPLPANWLADARWEDDAEQDEGIDNPAGYEKVEGPDGTVKWRRKNDGT